MPLTCEDEMRVCSPPIGEHEMRIGDIAGIGLRRFGIAAAPRRGVDGVLKARRLSDFKQEPIAIGLRNTKLQQHCLLKASDGRLPNDSAILKPHPCETPVEL